MSAVQTFQAPATGEDSGSTQFIADPGNSCFWQCTAATEWAYASGNSALDMRGISLELPGYSGRAYDAAVIEYAAKFIAWCNQDSGVPIRRLTHADLRANPLAIGVTSHDEVPDPDNANLKGGRYHHTDPGPTFPWSTVMARAAEIAKGGAPGSVTTGGKSGMGTAKYTQSVLQSVFATGFRIDERFREFWATCGGAVKPASVAASIAIFGYPLSWAVVDTEVNRPGLGNPTVQYFERARLEYWRDGSITIGRIGAEVWEVERSFLPAETSQPEQP